MATQYDHHDGTRDPQLDSPSAALALTNQTSIPATVLSVVVPPLFDLEACTIVAADRAEYAALLADAGTRQHMGLPNPRLTLDAVSSPEGPS